MAGREKPNQQAGVTQDTPGRIVLEATRLFAEKGYDGVSIKEISDAAGVNIAAVNYHFASKANLFQRIIEQFLSELFVSSRKALLPPQNHEELKVRLEVFVRQTLEAMIRRPDVITIIHREMEKSNEVFQKTILKHREALIDFLDQAKKSGLVAPDVEPFFAADFLMGQISHARRKGRTREDLFGSSASSVRLREQWIRQTLRLFLGGVIKV